MLKCLNILTQGRNILKHRYIQKASKHSQAVVSSK